MGRTLDSRADPTPHRARDPITEPAAARRCLVNAFIIELDNQPGQLASVAKATAESGINITAIAGAASGEHGSIILITNDEAGTRSCLDGHGFSYRPIGLASAALEDRPGALAEAATRLADAGVNVEALLPTGMAGGRITVAFGVGDVEAAKQALGELAGAAV